MKNAVPTVRARVAPAAAVVLLEADADADDDADDDEADEDDDEDACDSNSLPCISNTGKARIAAICALRTSAFCTPFSAPARNPSARNSTTARACSRVGDNDDEDDDDDDDAELAI
jgi:hypothetical protein